MNITLIFSTILAIAEAIPVIRKTIDDFYLFIINHEISKLSKIKIGQEQKRKALFNSIKEAKNNEDRKALSIILNDIMSDSSRDV